MTQEVRELVVVRYHRRKGLVDMTDPKTDQDYSFSIVGLHGARSNRYPRLGDRITASTEGTQVVTARYTEL